MFDAMRPFAYIVEAAAKGKLNQENTVVAVQTAPRLKFSDDLMSNSNPNLTDMAEEDKRFVEAAPNIFGDGFSEKAKERDDKLKVLRNTKPPAKKPSS